MERKLFLKIKFTSNEFLESNMILLFVAFKLHIWSGNQENMKCFSFKTIVLKNNPGMKVFIEETTWRCSRTPLITAEKLRTKLLKKRLINFIILITPTCTLRGFTRTRRMKDSRALLLFLCSTCLLSSLVIHF